MGGVVPQRKIIVNIATSADGYVARPDGNLDWLTERPAPKGFYGLPEFERPMDAKILGRKTFDRSLQMGARFSERAVHYVFSRGAAACFRARGRPLRYRVDRRLRRTPPHASRQERLDDGRRRDHRVLSGRGGDRPVHHHRRAYLHWGRHSPPCAEACRVAAPLVRSTTLSGRRRSAALRGPAVTGLSRSYRAAACAFSLQAGSAFDCR